MLTSYGSPNGQITGPDQQMKGSSEDSGRPPGGDCVEHRVIESWRHNTAQATVGVAGGAQSWAILGVCDELAAATAGTGVG